MKQLVLEVKNKLCKSQGAGAEEKQNKVAQIQINDHAKERQSKNQANDRVNRVYKKQLLL